MDALLTTTALSGNPTFRLTNSIVKDLTRAYADEFRQLEVSPTDRILDQGRVKHLKQKIEAGLAVTFHWSTAKLDAKTYRMNGQHSSTVLCGFDGNFPAGLKVHLDEYEVNSPEGLALLFRQFDDRKSSRSAADVAGAYQGLYEPLHDVPRGAAKLAIEGICWYDKVIEGAPVPLFDDKYARFSDVNLHPFIRWLGELFTSKTPELSSKIGAIGAMYATFDKNPPEAKMFWENVARGGIQYEDNAPETVLDKWLRRANEKDEHGNVIEKINPAQAYQGSIFAWNARRESRTINTIKSETKKGFYKVAE